MAFTHRCHLSNFPNSIPSPNLPGRLIRLRAPRAHAGGHRLLPPASHHEAAKRAQRSPALPKRHDENDQRRHPGNQTGHDDPAAEEVAREDVSCSVHGKRPQDDEDGCEDLALRERARQRCWKWDLIARDDTYRCINDAMLLPANESPLFCRLEMFSFLLLGQLLRCEAFDVAVVGYPDLRLESLPVKVVRAKDIGADDGV